MEITFNQNYKLSYVKNTKDYDSTTHYNDSCQIFKASIVVMIPLAKSISDDKVPLHIKNKEN